MPSPNHPPADTVKQTDEGEAFRAVLLCPGNHKDDAVLDQLLDDSRVAILDSRDDQLRCLRGLRPSPDAALPDEPTQWAYYPWRRSVVGVLGPRGYRAVRLERNRSPITTEGNGRPCELRIGVAGLTVGYAIAHALALQGVCDELRLADFDQLEPTNLNGVLPSVLEVGVNRAIAAARRIAELDPYIRLDVITASVTSRILNDFLEELDVVVEECDSLDVKVMVCEAARQRRLPVVSSTSDDSGLVDVERFDLQPDPTILHSLLEKGDSAERARLALRDQIVGLSRITLTPATHRRD